MSTKHTPTPLVYLADESFGGDIRDIEFHHVATVVNENDADGELLARAFNSYVKHCKDPVAAAESDLLGRALEVIQELVDWSGWLPDDYKPPAPVVAAFSILRETEESVSPCRRCGGKGFLPNDSVGAEPVFPVCPCRETTCFRKSRQNETPSRLAWRSWRRKVSTYDRLSRR